MDRDQIEKNIATPDREHLQAEDILIELQLAKQELEKLNAHKLVQATNTLSGLLFFMFLKGIAFGFGTVVGATIVVSLLVYLLSPFELVPVVGDWVARVVEEVQRR